MHYLTIYKVVHFVKLLAIFRFKYSSLLNFSEEIECKIAHLTIKQIRYI